MEHDMFVLMTSVLEELRTIRQNQEYNLVKKYPELSGKTPQQPVMQKGGK